MSEIYIPESPSIWGRLRRLWRADSGIRHKAYAVAAVVAAGLGYLLTGATMHMLAGASITPITNTSGGASGISFSGDAYDVSCTASAATGTMYPALYDGSAWTIYYSYPCSYDGSVVTKVSCIFPARRAVGGEVLTWNAFKTGSATLSSCTAQQRYNGAPFPSAPPPAAASGVTSVTCGTGLTGGVITTTGTCAADFGTASSTIAQGNDTRFPPAPSAAGRVLYDNGSAWTALAAGTSGQPLLSGGAGAPTWGYPAIVLGELRTVTNTVPATRRWGWQAALTTSTTNVSIAVGRIKLPAGTYTLTGTISAAVAAGQNLAISVYSASTVNGTYAEATAGSGATVTFVDTDAAETERSATFTLAAPVWVLFSTLYSSGTFTGYIVAQIKTGS